MSCSFGATKESMETENCNLETKMSVGESHKNVDTSCSEEETSNKARLNLGLFRKYLLMNAQHNTGKTNEEESKAFKKSHPRPLVPPKSGASFRHPSFLEQKLFPGIRSDIILPTLSDCKSSTAQLTIFYSGAINVFDNVPVDKAQAIMLLAGESSSSAPMAKKMPDTDVGKPKFRSNLPSICKLQADLPIARKYSLQRFMEKRRVRITNKSPYTPTTKHNEGDEPTADDGSNEKRSLSLSLFPSRLGYFLANKGL